MSADANPPKPDAKDRRPHLPADEDAVDFSRLPPVEGGSAAASQSQISGPLSGTNVIAWTDLMRARTQADIDLDAYDGVRFDSASDRDILERVLAETSPPAPAPEKAPRPPSEECIDIGKPTRGSGSGSDVIGSPEGRSSVIAGDPASSVFGVSGDSAISMSGHGAEPSAVDLGSEAVIELSFPGSGRGGGPGSGKAKKAGPVARSPDSDTVNLLEAGRSSGPSSPLAMTAVSASRRPDSGLPGTKRFGLRSDSVTWKAALVGGLAGLAVCVSAWLTGTLSAGDDTTHRTPSALAQAAELDAYRRLRQEVENSGLDLAAAPDPAAALGAYLNQAKSWGAEVTALRSQFNAVRDAVRKASPDAADPAAAVQKLARSKETAEKARRAAESNARSATVLLSESEESRKRLKTELDSANERLATMAKNPPTPAVSPAELTRLHEAAQRAEARAAELHDRAAEADRRAESAAAALAAVAAAATDLRADRALHRGLSEYFAGRYAAAEEHLRVAGGDARSLYFLGLVRLAQGRPDLADVDLQKAAECERRNRPNPSAVDTLLERLPPDARAAISRARGRS